MIRHLILACIALFVGNLTGGLAAATNNTAPFNVLFIAVDDLRPELGCYGAGHIHSPNIDRLASTGLMFRRAYCQQAVCNPSRTSLMTGLRPDTIGVTGNHVHFRSKQPNVVTLPQHFKNHGYLTQAIGKIYHGVFPDGASKTRWDTMGDPDSWSVPAIRFGPRYYYTEEGIAAAKKAYLNSCQPKNPSPNDWTRKLVFGPATESPNVPDNTLYDGKVADAAMLALRKLKQQPDQPFFLAVGFIKPHSPYIAPQKYFELYPRVELASHQQLPQGSPTFAGHKSGELRRYTDQPNSGPIAETDQRRVRQAYYACVSYIDAQIGRVLDELDRLGLAENTIVSLYGDHGYHLGEQGLWGKTTNFELDTRVPLIVWAPGMKATGRRSDSLVELVDVYPTLVELAGLPFPEHVEGKSFASILDDSNATTKSLALSQYPRSGGLMGYSMRTETQRLTQWIHKQTGQIRATEFYEYHDGSIETENLASHPNRQPTVRRLTKRMFQAFGLQRPTSPDKQAQESTDASHSTSSEEIPATKNRDSLSTILPSSEVDRNSLSVARVFGHHMVLQANAPIRIWGNSNPESAVTVAFAEQTSSTSADKDGHWMVVLNAEQRNSSVQEMVVSCEDESITLHDILVGEVWLCAGQSNMEWPVSKSAESETAFANSNDPQMRLLNFGGGPRGGSGVYSQKLMDRLDPSRFSQGTWRRAGVESVQPFSAVGYYFANRLRNELDCPVGIINVSIGGTPIESWISESVLRSRAQLASTVEGDWLENPVLDAWCKQRARSNLKRGLSGELKMPGDPFGPQHSFKPGFMFASGVQPFVPMSVKGVIWYQGESNAADRKRVEQYDLAFPVMVSSWRKSFGNPTMPFVFVQLPAMDREYWPEFREYQRRSLSNLSNVGMAITIDTGHPTNVHPKEKKPVGDRLAKWALGHCYGKSGPTMGPLLQSNRIRGSQIVLTFDQVGGGLRTRDDSAPNHFEVAGIDGTFHPATAHIEGSQQIVLSSEAIPQPVHARYAWKPFPKPFPNVVNSTDLPMSPFTAEDQF